MSEHGLVLGIDECVNLKCFCSCLYVCLYVRVHMSMKCLLLYGNSTHECFFSVLNSVLNIGLYISISSNIPVIVPNRYDISTLVPFIVLDQNRSIYWFRGEICGIISKISSNK